MPVGRGASADLLTAVSDELSPLHSAGVALNDASDAVLTKAARAGVLADGIDPAPLCRLTSAGSTTVEHSQLSHAEQEEMLDIIHRDLLRHHR